MNINTARLRQGKGYKNSQARNYVKEGQSLRNLRHSNTQSQGMLQPFSEIIYENNESLEMSNSKNSLYSWKHESSAPKFNSSWGKKSIRNTKVGSSLKSEYLKRNKLMNNLNSTTNLKKQLSTNKSFNSFYNKTMAKGQIHDSDSERTKQLEKIGLEKGVRKWEIKLVNQSCNEIGARKDYKPNSMSSSDFTTLKNFKTKASGLHKYKSQSNLLSTEWRSCNENQSLIEEIAYFDEKVKSMEEMMKIQNEAYEMQLAECEEKLKWKDFELKTSRDQVSQLLRIIEQITKSTHKSSFGSKTSESEDTQWIVIREQLEIENNSDSDAGLNKYKTIDRASNPPKLKEIEWISYESADGSLCLISPTWSNISEGNTGIYVEEVKRNVLQRKHDASVTDEFKLPETESICKTLESLNRPLNRRKTTNGMFEQLNRNISKSDSNERLVMTARQSFDSDVSS